MWSGDEEPAPTTPQLPVSSTLSPPISRRKRRTRRQRFTPQLHSRTSESSVVVSEKHSLCSLSELGNTNTEISGSTDSSSEDLGTDFHSDARVEELKNSFCVAFPKTGVNPSETANSDFVNPESVSPLSYKSISDFSGCAKTELRGFKTVSAEMFVSDTVSSDTVYSHSLDIEDSFACAFSEPGNIKTIIPETVSFAGEVQPKTVFPEAEFQLRHCVYSAPPEPGNISMSTAPHPLSLLFSRPQCSLLVFKSIILPYRKL